CRRCRTGSGKSVTNRQAEIPCAAPVELKDRAQLDRAVPPGLRRMTFPAQLVYTEKVTSLRNSPAGGTVERRVKAVGLTEFGGPEVLCVLDPPEPQAGPGEVRIRVHAAAVNPTD